MRLVWCLTALLLFAFGASAGAFTPLPVLGTTRLDLDVEDGHYCGWMIDDVGQANALRATVQIHRLGSDPKWAPSFNIVLKNSDKRVTFNILAPAPGLPLVVRVKGPADKAEDMGQVVGKLDLDTPLDVAIDWTADGNISVTIGGQTVTAALGGPVKGLEITGSTGEIEFNPLQIGTASP